MKLRLLPVLSLFLFIVSACAYSPEINTKTTDEFGCYLAEKYDVEEDSCYLDCENLNEQQCDELAFQVYGELDDFIDENFAGYDRNANEDSNATLIARYSLNEALALNELLNTEPDNDRTFRLIWRAVLQILPREFLREEVAEYRINTDGVDNTLAFVTLHESFPEKWIISIDPADFTNEKDKEFIHTVIHEFAHIVFLNKMQVELESTDSCTNYSITEGCSKTDSYINAFYTRFWTDIIKDNPTALADEEVTDEDDILEFYEKYSTQFVSEYAATNPVEDIAEIFVHFVLEKKPQIPATIAKQKIAFLHQFPELTQLRNKIRAKLRNRL